MALQSILRIEGITATETVKGLYVIQDLNYEITKSVDNLKPTSNPKGGLINFTILSPDPDDLTFHEWILNNDIIHECQFYLPIVKGIKHDYKAMLAKEASCVSLREFHSGSNGQQVYMQITLCFSAILFGKEKAIGFNNIQLYKRENSKPYEWWGTMDFI